MAHNKKESNSRIANDQLLHSSIYTLNILENSRCAFWAKPASRIFQLDVFCYCANLMNYLRLAACCVATQHELKNITRKTKPNLDANSRQANFLHCEGVHRFLIKTLGFYKYYWGSIEMKGYCLKSSHCPTTTHLKTSKT